MREFVKGWRRRVDVVTLVMACVLTGLWVRSTQIADVIWFSFGDQQFLILAVDGVVSCSSRRIENTVQVFTMTSIDRSDPTINWEKLPFLHSLRSRVWTAPYWPFVLPLTLLSAYLLLWKPRKRTEPEHA